MSNSVLPLATIESLKKMLDEASRRMEELKEEASHIRWLLDKYGAYNQKDTIGTKPQGSLEKLSASTLTPPLKRKDLVVEVLRQRGGAMTSKELLQVQREQGFNVTQHSHDKMMSNWSKPDSGVPIERTGIGLYRYKTA